MDRESNQPKHCLNCRAQLNGPFCAECGQAASVERYTFKSLSLEIYKKFHAIDAFATWRTFGKLTTQPGTFVSNYLAGERVGVTAAITYFFYFFVIEIFIRSILFRLTGNADLGNTTEDNFQMQIITLVSTIFWGFLWWVFYRRSPLNLPESIIAAIYFVAQVNVYSLAVLIMSAPFANRYPAATDISAYVELFGTFFYGVYFSRRLFGDPLWMITLKQFILTILFLASFYLVMAFNILGSATLFGLNESASR